MIPQRYETAEQQDTTFFNLDYFLKMRAELKKTVGEIEIGHFFGSSIYAPAKHKKLERPLRMR